MPRPKKRVDEVCALLEVAYGELSNLYKFNQPTTLIRIQQAMARHPDLHNLLKPIEEEIRQRQHLVITAKAAISTAKARVMSSE